MGGGIYLMRDDGELVEMNERGYDTVALLPVSTFLVTLSLVHAPGSFSPYYGMKGYGLDSSKCSTGLSRKSEQRNSANAVAA